MMKRLILVVVVLVALTGSSAWAQFITNARELGMGLTTVAVADDAAAAYQNPAGLACLGLKGDDGQSFVNDLAATYLNANLGFMSATEESLAWSGFSPGSGWGLGAFYGTGESSLLPITTHLYGVGLGKALWNTRFALGANLTRFEVGPGTGSNVFNAGLMFGRAGDRLKLGVRANDVTQQVTDVSFDAGLAWQISRHWLLAADGLDVTEKFDPISYNVGTEYSLNPHWTARLGATDVSNDARWSGGLGFRMSSWRLDVGYLNETDATVWNISGGLTF
jgi:hypothetical protein